MLCKTMDITKSWTKNVNQDSYCQHVSYHSWVAIKSQHPILRQASGWSEWCKRSHPSSSCRSAREQLRGAGWWNVSACLINLKVRCDVSNPWMIFQSQHRFTQQLGCKVMVFQSQPKNSYFCLGRWLTVSSRNFGVGRADGCLAFGLLTLHCEQCIWPGRVTTPGTDTNSLGSDRNKKRGSITIGSSHNTQHFTNAFLG